MSPRLRWRDLALMIVDLVNQTILTCVSNLILKKGMRSGCMHFIISSRTLAKNRPARSKKTDE